VIAFLINRARRHWQVLSTVLLGVLVSTALLASGPLIVNTVMDFALPHKLRSSLEDNGTILLTNYNNLDFDAYRNLDSEIRDILNTNIGNFSEIVSTVSSPWGFPWQEEALITDERINLMVYGGIEDQILIISGNWPNDGATDQNIVPAMIFEPLAQAYGLGVGDYIPMSFKNNESEPSFWIEVSGIIRPINARNPYWIIDHNPFQLEINPRYIAQSSVILSDQDLFRVIKTLFPNAKFELNWLGVIDPDQITSGKVAEIIDGIEATKTGISSFESRVSLKTNIDSFFSNYESQAASIRPPLYLLVGEVLLLAIYYVVMVATMSVKQVEGEFAILTSRGASRGQLFKMQAFEASLICSVAFICGPLLAYGLVWSLAKFGPLADVSQIDWIASLPAASWMAAAISVLACFTVLLVPVIPAMRSSIVEHRRNITRRNKKPWWQRYYIDVFLLIGGLVAIWRLSLYGSISGSISGSIDWLLLFAPLALLIGSATILLRLFPAIFRLLAFLTARGRGLTAALAFWQTSRDPTHVTRLILLFTLAMALGILSAGLNATLTSSEAERARYASGGEIRLASESFIPQSSFSSLQSITRTSPVWRGTGKANVRSYRSMPEFELLAIDPFSFAAVSQYRTDFTDDYIGFVLGKLIVDPEQLPVTTIPLPGKPTRFGIWVADPFPKRTNVDLLENLNIRAKFQTSEGEIFAIDLILPPTNDKPNPTSDSESDLIGDMPTWRYFDTDLPTLAAEGYPISLHSLWLKIRSLPSSSGEYYNSQGPLVIDNISTTDSSGDYKIVEGFEQITTIWQTEDIQSVASYTKSDITHTGDASMRLFFGAPGTSHWMVISPVKATRREMIPVLASPVFLETTGLQVGDKFITQTNGISLPLEIKDKVNYFPTMYETSERGYLVIARDSLLAELNRSSRKPVNSNETWLLVDNTQQIPALMDEFPQATHVWEVEAERIKFKSDPLTLGLRNVIFLGYTLTLLLSLVGFATYFYLSARQRETIYGVLRSLGLSTQQLYASLVLEQLVLIGAGLALGIVLGTLLNRIILPGLPISFGDLPPIPPFQPHEDWGAVTRLIIILIVSFFITLAIGTYLLWRTKLHQVLRIGEE